MGIRDHGMYVSFIFLLLLIANLFPLGHAKCKFGWDYFEGKCYRITDERQNWNDSQASCQSMDSTLASVHDPKTNSFIYNLARSTFWVGGMRTGLGSGKENFAWSDNSPFDYTNWAKGQPDSDENRIQILKASTTEGFEDQDMKWNDQSEKTEIHAICQYDI